MQLWRITTEKWALDRTGDGARLQGGRWNPVGWPALYAGTNIEICALEKYVHISGVKNLKLHLVSIHIPDQASLYHRPKLGELPSDWAALPVSAGSQEFGKKWLKSCQQLVMFVPSVIIPEATNAVINPAHPVISKVKIQITREFQFDSRMQWP